MALFKETQNHYNLYLLGGSLLSICIFGYIGYRLGITIDEDRGSTLINVSNFGIILIAIASLIAIFLLYKTYTTQRYTLLTTQRAAAVQKVDNNFFSMLSILNQITTAMEGSVKVYNARLKRDVDKSYKGRLYVKHALLELLSHHNSVTIYVYDRNSNSFIEYYNDDNPKIIKTPTGNSKTISQLRSEIGYEFEVFYKRHTSCLGHYYRYVYNIIKFIQTNSLSQRDVIRYITHLQAQLSNDELGLLFYGAISPQGRNKMRQDIFRQWLDHYGILENIPLDNLIDSNHILFYPRTKFKFSYRKV